MWKSFLRYFCLEGSTKSCSCTSNICTQCPSPACLASLVSNGAGVALGPDGVETIFKSKDSKAPNLFKLPSSIIMLAADSSGVIPSISKLTPGQAAYHFLAGYQNGNFVPAYESGPMSLDPVVVAKELSSQLTKSNISSFLANVNVGEKHLTGEEILKLVEATLTEKLPSSKGQIAKAELWTLRIPF
jgi:ATP-dependent phosphoenolpyruvate carboxykinase